MRADLQTAFSLATIFLLLGCFACAQSAAPPQPAPSENAFTPRDASVLLRRLSEALDGHSEHRMLALFDLAPMKDGPLFRQQISVLFAQSESIRVHLNLVAASAEAQMAVDAEIEIQPVSGGPPSRRNERLGFKVARAGSGWKFVDVQPRGFFSLP